MIKETTTLPKPTTARIKVSIKHKTDPANGYLYTVTCSHPLPTNVAAILPYLKKKQADYIRNYVGTTYRIAQALPYVIGNASCHFTARDFTRAIAAYCAAQLRLPEAEEIEFIAPTERGFLSIGNVLFELHATDYVIGGQRALPVLRRRVIAAAKSESESLITTAQSRADELVRTGQQAYNNAQSAANTMRREAEQFRAAAKLVPPAWLRAPGLFRIWDDGIAPRGQIGGFVSVNLKVFEIRHEGTTYRWHSTPSCTPFPILLFVGVEPNGAWSATSLQIQASANRDFTRAYEAKIGLPHNGPSGSCLTLGTTQPITSMPTFLAAFALIENAITVMNMGSPYTNVSYWDERLLPFIPKKLTKLFDQWRRTGHLDAGISAEVRKTADEVIKEDPLIFATPDPPPPPTTPEPTIARATTTTTEEEEEETF